MFVKTLRPNNVDPINSGDSLVPGTLVKEYPIDALGPVGVIVGADDEADTIDVCWSSRPKLTAYEAAIEQFIREEDAYIIATFNAQGVKTGHTK